MCSAVMRVSTSGPRSAFSLGGKLNSCRRYSCGIDQNFTGTPPVCERIQCSVSILAKPQRVRVQLL